MKTSIIKLVPNLFLRSSLDNKLCSKPNLDSVIEKFSKILLSSTFDDAKYFPHSFQSQST